MLAPSTEMKNENCTFFDGPGKTEEIKSERARGSRKKIGRKIVVRRRRSIFRQNSSTA